MSTIYECPGCGNRVGLPDGLILEIGDVGCLNEEEHDDHEGLVMYEQKQTDGLKEEETQ